MIYEQALVDAKSHKYRLFREFRNYQRFVLDELFPYAPIKNHPLYQRAILFVLQRKSPIHFLVETREQQYSYTGCYYISPIPKREGRYEHDSIFSLFNLHEVIHQLFNYPRNITGYGVRPFDELMSINERIASNETEFWAYFRIPCLRGSTRSILPRIMYDALIERGVDPAELTIAQMEAFRRSLLGEDGEAQIAINFPGTINGAIRTYLLQFVRGNKDFLAHRLDELRNLPTLHAPSFESYLPYSYDVELLDFIAEPSESEALQKRYETNVLNHIQLLFMLEGRTDYPMTFGGIFNRWSEVDECRPFVS